jgi:DNA-binding CsgD family transcriptional regulator
MIAVELVLLIIAYTALIVSLTFGIICYKRNIESIETVVFTISLILLIISILASSLFASLPGSPVSVLPTLLSMLLVSSTTLLNTLKERDHTISPMLKRVHTGIGLILFLAAIISFSTGHLPLVQWLIIYFLIGSVATSMVIIRTTKPHKRYAHLEKSDRLFAAAFFILVPLYLIFHFGFGEQYGQLQIGFILPTAFILLAANKTYDDLKRLSIIRKAVEPQTQQLVNYGLTGRETEVAALLLQGSSYQSISDSLFISLLTVKTHSSNIYKKCSVKNRIELIRLLND